MKTEYTVLKMFFKKDEKIKEFAEKNFYLKFLDYNLLKFNLLAL